MAKYDDMSFGRAFAAARREKGKGKTFTWKGKSYSTNRADDAPSSGSRGSSGSSEDSFVARNRRAIERAEAERAPAVRPRARPTEEPKVRPRARPTDKAPTSTNASSPRVTTTALEPAAQGRASTPRNLANVTIEDWVKMSPAERRQLGLPNNRAAARRMLEGQSNSTSNRGRRPGGAAARGMAKGGMVKKSGYAKGGVVKANCGASMKPTQKGTKK